MKNRVLCLKDLKPGDRVKESDGTMRLVVGNPAYRNRKLFINVDNGWTSFNEDPGNFVYGALCDADWNPLPEPEKTYRIGQRFKHRGDTWMLAPTTNKNEVFLIVVDAPHPQEIGHKCLTTCVADDLYAVPASTINRFFGEGEWEEEGLL